MLSSRILKGGALIEESRILVERWDPRVNSGENLAQLLEQNALAKRSQSRARDVLHSVLRARLVDAGPELIPALKELVDHPRGFVEACYFEACQTDDLLARYAEEALWHWYESGRIGISVEDTTDWIDQLVAAGRLPDWTPNVRGRAARGLLATTRDFGVLRGAARKELAPPRLSPTGFSYVAFRLHQQGVNAGALAKSDVWRRWLLDQAEVDQLFAEAAHLGILRQSRAGSVIRVDWEVPSLIEVAHAVA